MARACVKLHQFCGQRLGATGLLTPCRYTTPSPGCQPGYILSVKCPQCAATVAVRGKLQGRALATGKRLWGVTQLPEKPRRLCAAEGAVVLVQTQDKAWSSVDLGTGAVSPAEAPASCVGLWADQRQQVGPDSMGQWVAGRGGTLSTPTGPHAGGLDPRRVPSQASEDRLTRDTERPGHRCPDRCDTAAPFLQPSRFGPPKFQPRSHEVQARRPRLCDHRRRCRGRALYDERRPPSVDRHRHRRWQRRWDVAVPRLRSGHVLAGLTSNGDLVALSMWGLLAVFDVTSGRHLYSIPN